MMIREIIAAKLSSGPVTTGEIAQLAGIDSTLAAAHMAAWHKRGKVARERRELPRKRGKSWCWEWRLRTVPANDALSRADQDPQPFNSSDSASA